ncbi:MAG: NAD-dependent epimerase/dehydratase family protein [Candidatus Hodarchaeales archaeon]|jgi:nucleoside-diphosphate-sugar epimerase
MQKTKQIKSTKIEKNSQMHVVLGVNGNSGRFVVEELLKQGFQVKGISRSGKGPDTIEIIKADALDIDQLTRAVKGANVIYHCLGLPYPDWFDKHPVIMRNLIQATSQNGFKTKIVFADNLYAFGKEGAELGPLNEETPMIASDEKGKLRKKLADILFDADKEGKIIATIGHASDFFGPNASNSILEVFSLPQLAKKKPSAFFANLKTKHSWIYLPDFARSLVLLGTNDLANGKSWILPHYEATTIENFITQLYEVNKVEIPVKVKTRPQIILKLAGLFNKVIKEYSKVNYQMHMDWVVDDSKIRSTFTFESTPLNIAFKNTFNSYIN